MTAQYLKWVSLVVAVVLFGIFLWPGMYNYQCRSAFCLRINKITGTVHRLENGRWVRLGLPRREARALDELALLREAIANKNYSEKKQRDACKEYVRRVGPNDGRKFDPHVFLCGD